MKVLISAYACEPHKGSEPGAGWNWSVAAAQSHQVWALTRANNRGPIERELARQPVANLRFVYVDLPDWARRWKKGQRGVRLYYALWQLAALRAARRLHARERFDVVHHLTFANMWLPALVGRLDAPFVYGPVGGGPTVPLRLYRALGIRGALGEARLRVLRGVSRANPLVRVAWRHADLVVAQNEETAARMRALARAPVTVRPHASVASGTAPPRAPRRPGRRRAVCAGRLVAWKGTSLAIRAIAEVEDWELEIVGRGPDERRLRGIVDRLGLGARVRFTPWMSQDELWGRFASADALLLPSLRDDAPLVVAEAVAAGLPVVAFDQGGPAALAATAPDAIELVSRDGGGRALAFALAERLAALDGAREHAPSAGFGLDSNAAALADIYARAVFDRETDMRISRSAGLAGPAKSSKAPLA